MFGRIRPFRGRGSPFRQIISSTLVQVGERHGFKTQPELAKCLGVSERTVRNWTTGRKLVDVQSVFDCKPLRDDFFAELARRVRESA